MAWWVAGKQGRQRGRVLGVRVRFRRVCGCGYRSVCRIRCATGPHIRSARQVAHVHVFRTYICVWIPVEKLTRFDFEQTHQSVLMGSLAKAHLLGRAVAPAAATTVAVAAVDTLQLGKTPAARVTAAAAAAASLIRVLPLPRRWGLVAGLEPPDCSCPQGQAVTAAVRCHSTPTP